MNWEVFNRDMIEYRKQEVKFLEHFAQADYNLIDLPLIEQFDWTHLSVDDLQMMPARYKWQQGNEIHSLRSDWTHALVKYRHQYHLPFNKLAYAGPVYLNDKERYQFGVENYTDSVNEQIATLKEMVNFIQQEFSIKLCVGVVGHNTLLQKLITKEALDDKITVRFIKERNRQALASKLGEDNPIVKIMGEAAIDQVQYVKDNFPHLKQQVDEIDRWREVLQSLDIKHVHADMLALPMQSYYQGVFFQLYSEDTVSPIVLGGQYFGPTKAFGVAINIK